AKVQAQSADAGARRAWIAAVGGIQWGSRTTAFLGHVGQSIKADAKGKVGSSRDRSPSSRLGVQCSVIAREAFAMRESEIVTSLPILPPRRPDSNKGDFGRVLVVAGSRGMTGAAILCGTAALRGGAGLVRLAIPSDVLPIVANGQPCFMTT